MSSTTSLILSASTAFELLFFSLVFILFFLFLMYIFWGLHNEKKDDY